MSDLPVGWAWAKLEDLAALEPRSITDGPFGSNLKTEHYTADGPLVIRLQNVGDGAFRDDRAHIDEDRYERLKNHAVQPGDVLIAGLGEQLPRACVAPAWLPPAIVKADVFRFRPYPEVNAHYVASILNSPPLRALSAPLISGVGRPRMNLAKVRSLILPLPPSAEQERIVAAIEEHFSHLDAGVESLERARVKLRRMRAAMLQAAVLGELSNGASAGSGEDLAKLALDARRRCWEEQRPNRPYKDPATPAVNARSHSIPDGWGLVSLEAVTDPLRVICYGILKPKTTGELTVPYVEVRDLAKKMLDPRTLNRTSEALHREFARSELAAGDVVLAIRGSYDRSAVVPPSVAGANMSRDVARIAALPQLLPAYLHVYLSSPPAQNHLASRARGVAVKGVNIGDLRAMPVPLPPLDEQRAIVNEVARIETLIAHSELVVEAGLRRSRGLRRAILNRGFAGRLVPQDPTEEPAAVLLERIAATRESSPKDHPRRSNK